MLFLPLSIPATGFESDRVPIATTRKNGDHRGSKVSAWPKRMKFSPSNNHYFVASGPILVSKASTFRKKNDLSNDVFAYAVQQKMTKLWLFKGFAQSTALHSNDHDSTDSTSDEERKSLVGLTSQAGWSCTKLHGASSCSWEQASKSRPDDRKSKGELSAEARLAPETVVIIYHTTDIVCSFHCQIIDCYDLNE